MSLSKKFAANQGEGLAFLAESSTSPSRARLQKIIAEKFPKSQWFTYDAIDSGIHQRAATQAFGQPVQVRFSISTRRRSSCRLTAIFSAAKTTRTITSSVLSKAANRRRRWHEPALRGGIAVHADRRERGSSAAHSGKFDWSDCGGVILAQLNGSSASVPSGRWMPNGFPSVRRT